MPSILCRWRLPLLLLCALVGCTSAAEQAQGEAQRGVELARQGEIAAAMERFERALERDPGNAMARFNLGLGHLHQGRRVRAAGELTAFVALRPEDARGHFELARARMLARGREAALRSLARAVRLGFDDYDLLTRDGVFAPLYERPQYLALEMTVAQRAGVAPTKGILAAPGAKAFGTGAQTVPGLRMGESRCAAGDDVAVADASCAATEGPPQHP